MPKLTDEQKQVFLEGFTFKGSVDVKREELVIFARKASNAVGNNNPWELLGYKIEESSISNNYDEESITDINGEKYHEINDKNESIEMSKQRFKAGRSELAEQAAMMSLMGLESRMNDYELLLVSKWRVDANDGLWARLIKNVSLTVDNLGGQGGGHTAGDCTFNGISDGEYGTVEVDETTGQPTFTPYTPPTPTE